MGYREAFDYGKMAREAARERDVLLALLEKRKQNPPVGGEAERLWSRENGVLYTMYLEQRHSAQELSRRAGEREKEGMSYAG